MQMPSFHNVVIQNGTANWFRKNDRILLCPLRPLRRLVIAMQIYQASLQCLTKVLSQYIKHTLNKWHFVMHQPIHEPFASERGKLVEMICPNVSVV